MRTARHALGAEGLDEGGGGAQLVAGHGGKQVVLDLHVEAGILARRERRPGRVVAAHRLPRPLRTSDLI